MVYTLLLVLSVTYSSVVDSRVKTKKDYVLYYSPIWIILILMLGLQYNVGTDYQAYLDVVSGIRSIDWIRGRSEFLFVYLVYLARAFGNPQLIFLFSALIKVTFLAMTTYKVREMGFKLNHFFFLYFTLLLIFFNQFNGIRQYIAVHIIMYALMELKNKKYFMFFILVLMARFFHYSAIYFLIFIPLRKVLEKKIPVKYILVMGATLITLNFFNVMEIYKLLMSFTKYKNYVNGSYLGSLSFQGIITKIPKLMIVLYSAYLVEKDEISDNYRYLINLSYISSLTLIASFSASVIWRFYQYFDFFIIFPVIIMMHNNDNKKVSKIFAVALFSMFFIKAGIIPRGEYLYRSILTK